MKKRRIWFPMAAAMAILCFPGTAMAEENSDAGSVIEESIVQNITDDTAPADEGISVDAEEPLNGLHKDPSGQTDALYYYQDGVIQDITEIKQIGDEWYNLVHGCVVGNTLARDDKGLWYINADGKVDFTYTGVFEYEDELWYVADGHADDSVNSVEKVTIDGKEGWWVIRDGKVEFDYTGYAENSNGWWYIRNGKVDFTYNGKVFWNHRTYTVKGGKVQY